MLRAPFPFSCAQSTGHRRQGKGWERQGAAAAGDHENRSRGRLPGRNLAMRKEDTFGLWRETQKREAYLCLTEVLGEGSLKYNAAKRKRILTPGTPGTWVRAGRARALLSQGPRVGTGTCSPVSPAPRLPCSAVGARTAPSPGVMRKQPSETRGSSVRIKQRYSAPGSGRNAPGHLPRSREHELSSPGTFFPPAEGPCSGSHLTGSLPPCAGDGLRAWAHCEGHSLVGSVPSHHAGSLLGSRGAGAGGRCCSLGPPAAVATGDGGGSWCFCF